MNQGVYAMVDTLMKEQDAKYGQFASAHEALGVCLEEWDELRAAIHANDLESVQKECIDLAAPLLRLAEQLFINQRLRRRSVKAAE